MEPKCSGTWAMPHRSGVGDAVGRGHEYDIADAGFQVRSGTWAMPHRSGVGDAVGLGVTCGIADVGASPVRQAR